MQLARSPVRFVYPNPPTLSAAYVGLVRNSPNPEAAKKFVNYLLSQEGQALLFHKNVGRLPIRSDVYKQAPESYPNPFSDEIFKKSRVVDLNISKQRYRLVNTLFDKLITFNLNDLKTAVKSIQCVEQVLFSQTNEEAEELLKLAEEALAWVPFDEMLLDDEDYLQAFEQESLPTWSEETVAEEGISHTPDRWSHKASIQYKKAKGLANQALKLMGKECQQ
jgi:spermidine/putrescine-binding protein